MVGEKITGIILSGGKSSRLGTEKGLAEFNGKPLIQYSIDTFTPLCERILISANNELDEYNKFGFEVVEDNIKGIGPLGGLLSCLEKSDTRYNFILSCDVPFVPPELFSLLLDSIENLPVAMPVHNNGFFEPLCTVYATNIIWDLRRFIETKNYKIIDFLEKINAKKVVVDSSLPFYNDEIFTNINTRSELNRKGINDKR